MSLADGLGKLHDVPAALSRLSPLSLIQGLPVAPAHVQNFRAMGELLAGFYPKMVRLLWAPQSDGIQLKLTRIEIPEITRLNLH